MVIIVSIPIAGFSNDLSDRFGIGLGHPYLALKYGFNPKLSGEVRAAFGEGITVYGVRAYYNFNPESMSVLFLGLEGDGVTFDKGDMAGTGFVLMPFVGIEHFITESLTFNFDIGPAYISLESEGVSVRGIEWVYNLGINFYLK
ncbi:MAG: hypothetical protein ACE5IT_08760 [bacterium]